MAEYKAPTPETDAEEARQRQDYDRTTECSDPVFPADFEFARTMERNINTLIAGIVLELVVPVEITQHLGTPGKVVGYRCKICNHDGRTPQFEHDKTCLFVKAASFLSRGVST